MTAAALGDTADLVVRTANAGKVPTLVGFRSVAEATRRRCFYQLPARNSLAVLVGEAELMDWN